jgi:hypothetical protein
MDSDDPVRDRRAIAAGPAEREQAARRILDENWENIARLARLLAERRTLSRSDVEAEVFGAAEAAAGRHPQART